MTQRMHGSMDHAVDSLQRSLESGACGKINARAPACRCDGHAVRFKSAYNLGTEQARATEHHDPHPVRIVVRALLLIGKEVPWLSPVAVRR